MLVLITKGILMVKKTIMGLFAFIAILTPLQIHTWGYNTNVLNTTRSKLTATIDLQGRWNDSWEIPDNSSASDDHQGYCARSVTIIAEDGKLAGQTTTWSFGANTCRSVNLRAYEQNGALQISEY